MHNLKYPSKAGDLGSRDRDTKYILQHTINKMDLKMEISPEQQVAALLDFSSILHSDSFTCLGPDDHMGCTTCVSLGGDAQKLTDQLRAHQIDKEGRAAMAAGGVAGLQGPPGGGPVAGQPPHLGSCRAAKSPSHNEDNLLKGIGHVRECIFEEGEKTWAALVPECPPCPDCGEGLKCLSRHECAALARVERRGESDLDKRRTAFLPGEGHPCHTQHTQHLRAVQSAMTAMREAPPHPGGRPPGDSRGSADWRDRADKYAKCCLTIFRPEERCSLQTHKDTCGCS